MGIMKGTQSFVLTLQTGPEWTHRLLHLALSKSILHFIPKSKT